MLAEVEKWLASASSFPFLLGGVRESREIQFGQVWQDPLSFLPYSCGAALLLEGRRDDIRKHLPGVIW